MNIIIEGCDGAGKSTLARKLATALDMMYQPSEGPGKSNEELNSRIQRYAEFQNTIFDRHPCVSQVIYNKFREGAMIRLDNHLHFQKQLERSLVIYCADADFNAQEFKAHDTLEHIQLMRDNFAILHEQYDLWAVRHAHIIHHKFMSAGLIEKMATAWLTTMESD